ncbi:hypothetical protein MCG98_00775 [Ruminococcus sp. OA3]|uniref:hypothetical protein n=1 Tax=Ruminococcus sp. OA3 TaxID=2914164 RepID=UPI001F05E172|nr:hypothetical protein [Ruminococcus sp. OA3]MCH1981108.1 hypothetical protein [Ruminococcus sp. OA3]
MDTVQGMLLVFLGLNTLYDLRFRKILLWSVAAFSITGICGVCLLEQKGLLQQLQGLFPGILLLVIGKMTDGGVGYGDGLVVCVTGIYLGLWITCEVVLTAMLLSALWGIVQMVICRKGKNQEFPWIPFLMIAYTGRML